jgi:hypothetical protein
MAAEMKRCAQCGREGVRGFKILGGFRHARWGWVEPITVCAAKKACHRRRRPKRPWEDS